MLFALLLAIPFVSAAGNTFGSELLTPALAQIGCKTDFMVGVINSCVTDGPNATSLSQYATTLQNDQSQLQTYANNGDVDDFRTYVRSTYDPDLASATAAIREWRVDERKDFTNDTRTKLKDDYQSLTVTFQTCHFNAVKSYAQEKVNLYNDEILQYQGRITNLSGKIDTSSLSTLLSNAQDQIITPLQDAINGATNSSQVTDALGQYCLFDGCPSGTNFHLAAKFETTKLSLILGVLQRNATNEGLGSDVAAVQNNLSTAQTTLSSVGSSPYGPGQSDQVWNSIDAAADALIKLLRDLRAKLNNGGNSSG
jgi:hypothetical protein